MILHILPTTPPERNGLAAYAYKLWEHWPAGSEAWETLTLRKPDGADEAWPEVAKHTCAPSQESLETILATLKPTAVVLHYVPHGYDPNGVPRWLIQGLARARQSQGFPLYAILHELFVMSSLWRRSNLYAPDSKRLFTQLLSITDGWATSNELYRDLTSRFGGKADEGRVIPIGTNIEPQRPISIEPPDGKLRIALFGLSETRLRTLELHSKLVQALARRGLLRSITLIGAAAKDTVAELALVARNAPGVTILSVFDQPESSVSEALAETNIGLCLNPPNTVTKSGVYAAYCAHGVAPILPGKAEDPSGAWVISSRDVQKTIATLTSPETLDAVRQAGLLWATGPGSWRHIAQAHWEGLGATIAKAPGRNSVTQPGS